MSKRPLIIALAAVLGVFVLGCASAKDPKPVTPAVVAGSGQPAAATTAAEQTGPQKFKVGDVGNIKTADGAGTVTVTSVKVQGKSIVAAVTIACTSGKMDYNPFDWTALAGDGTKLDISLDISVKNALNSGTLGAGQKVTGNLVFEGTAAQARGAQIQLSVGLEAAAYWVNG